MSDFLKDRLGKIHAAGNHRVLSGTVEGVDFWSNDYLGLAGLRKEVLGGGARVQGEVEGAASGATGSRSISGDTDAYHKLERRIAEFHGHPAALVFNSGYTANLGLLSAVLKRGDAILYDELMHASCRDGVRLGFARAARFPHNDLEETLIRTCTNERKTGQVFVLTEGRFSMDGDVAPLREMAELCRKYGAHLIVDEAHSGGVDGKQGRGLVAELGLEANVFAAIITYGKAFGAHGAAVLGSYELRDYLINTCRPFIYTTGPAPVQWRSIEEAYDKMEALHSEQHARLQRVILGFRRAMTEAGVASGLVANDGPIQVLHLPGNDAVMAAEAKCREAGLLVKAIRSPTVAEGSERLRVCLHSFNTAQEVKLLVETFKGRRNNNLRF